MAINNFDANDVVAQFRDAVAGGTWQTMVCEVSLNGELVRDVSNLATKCGSAKSTGELDARLSGSGVANTSPTASQVSLKDVTDWIYNDTLLEGRLVNLAAGAVALGEAILIKGDGKFIQVNPSANEGESLTFDWVFEITGTVDVNETDEST